MFKRVKIAVLMAVAMGGSIGGVGAQEIGFIEDFALAEDRAAAIETLIPGTMGVLFLSMLKFTE